MSLAFVADECIDRQIVERLRRSGHDVTSIAEVDPGISDDEVLRDANHRRAFLLTADKDFGEIVYRQRRTVAGVVLIRLAGLTPETKAEIVAATIEEHGNELSDGFWVITPGSLRIRSRPANDGS